MGRGFPPDWGRRGHPLPLDRAHRVIRRNLQGARGLSRAPRANLGCSPTRICYHREALEDCKPFGKSWKRVSWPRPAGRAERQNSARLRADPYSASEQLGSNRHTTLRGSQDDAPASDHSPVPVGFGSRRFSGRADRRICKGSGWSWPVCAATPCAAGSARRGADECSPRTEEIWHTTRR